MTNQLKYSFDDEPVTAFFCDIGKKRMVSYFDGYWDVESDQYISAPCYFSIRDWSRIQCYIGPEAKRSTFEQSMGIVELFLYVKYDRVSNVLETCVLLVDRRCVQLWIHNPTIEMDVLSSETDTICGHDLPSNV